MAIVSTILDYQALSGPFATRTLAPKTRTVSGTVTNGGSGVVRTVLFITTYGLLVGSTQSAADGTYSFSIGLDTPIVVLVLGASGERPLAHIATPG